jgi:hypothetical protein
MTTTTTTDPRAAALAALADLADRAAELGHLLEGAAPLAAADLIRVVALAESARLALEAARGLVPAVAGREAGRAGEVAP